MTEQFGDAGRPSIVVGELHEAVPAAVSALARLDVFQRSGSLVHVTREAETTEDGIVRASGTPRIRPTRPSVLALYLSQAARFQRWKNTKAGPELTDCAVPKDVVQALHDLGEWEHIRPLRAVVDYPVLRPDGSVLCARGYDARTGLICEPGCDVRISDQPTQEDARRAAAILGDLVSDFPFPGPDHAAAWLAVPLTIVARPAIDGPVPATIFDAPERGTGKTLLASLPSWIVLGRAPSTRATPKEPAEWNKSLLSIAMAGDPYVMFDNVKQMIASDALEAAITSTSFGGRELGTNNDLTLPWITVLAATGNNMTVTTDLVRRSLHVRLESKVENPEERTGFKYPNLLAHVREHRAELLGAALTILRAYVVAGRPDTGLRPMGSFEAWSDLVRSAMYWAGCADPVETQRALRAAGDSDRSALETLLGAWWRRYQGRQISLSDVLRDAEKGSLPAEEELRDAVLEYCDDKGRLPGAKKLGKALAKDRDRIVAGLSIQKTGERSGTGTWRVSAAAGAGDMSGFGGFGGFKPSTPCEENQDRDLGSRGPQSHESHESHGSLFEGVR